MSNTAEEFEGAWVTAEDMAAYDAEDITEVDAPTMEEITSVMADLMKIEVSDGD